MTKIRPLFFFGILFITSSLFFSCQTNNETSEELSASTESSKNHKKVKFIQIDSLMIDVIGGFDIYDYNPNTQLLLAGDIGFGHGDIDFSSLNGNVGNRNVLGHLIINSQGEVIHRFKHTDRSPQGHGANGYDHFFMSDSTVGVLSDLGIFEYELNGDFVKKYAELNTLDFISMYRLDIAAVGPGGKLAIGLAKGLEEAGRAWDSLFQIVKPLHFYDLNQFKTGYEQLEAGFMVKYGFPDHPFFAPKSKYNVRQSPPFMSYNWDANEVYALYPEIPILETYDIESGKLKANYDLAPDHFGAPVPTGTVSGGISGYETLTWLNKGGRMANSYYKQMVQLGDYTLLRYNKAIPMEKVNELLVKGYRKSEEWPSIRRRNYRFYYQLFKDGEKLIPDFPLPILEPQEGQKEFMNDHETRGKIVGGDGLGRIYVLVPNDGNSERDYELIRVYKLELVNE